MDSKAVTTRLIRKNGRKGEIIARRWLRATMLMPHIEVLNDLIDLYVNGTYIEIKTCQEKIKAKDIGRNRIGRFTLDATQHAVLVMNDGAYLFVVLRPGRRCHILLVNAKDIAWRHAIAWTSIMKYQKRFTTKKIEFIPSEPMDTSGSA